jgi:acetylornithine/succinyldiaminopimelate/putrescine aminotransferase
MNTADTRLPTPAEALAALHALRDGAGPRQTQGLSDARVLALAARFPELVEAIVAAGEVAAKLELEYPGLRKQDERALIDEVQEGFVHFYPVEAVNPYVPLSARGPWVVTAHGAVVHDSGGYGMLGMGHTPAHVLAVLGQPQVQANIMTPSFAHKRLIERLRREVGRTRGGSPFSHFLCLNSGSEAMSIAIRICDIHAHTMTRPGGRYAGRATKTVAVRGAFHGRTDRPARISDSSRPKYQQHLKSFQGLDNLYTVPSNDVDALHAVFAQAEADGVYIEAVVMEPVMGEGNPGVGITRAFYDAARALTLAHDSMLIIDSIQAGLRAHGVLSLVDYPGFADAAAPDMESWSKAINGGQYPLSVLGLTGRAAHTYVRGLYGNTMTTNPRALEVAVAVLDHLSDELRQNIVRQGHRFVEALRGLQAEFPHIITGVSGTGLLFACDLDEARYPVMAADGGVELLCRQRGLGVIHGGKNALRFTPHFGVTDEEVELMISELRAVFAALPA